jgi:hypothetical protein
MNSCAVCWVERRVADTVPELFDKGKKKRQSMVSLMASPCEHRGSGLKAAFTAFQVIINTTQYRYVSKHPGKFSISKICLDNNRNC